MVVVRHVSKLLPFVSFVQAKIARLAKKFGEANQATENKKKQEVRNDFSTLLPPVIFESLCSTNVIIDKESPVTRCLISTGSCCCSCGGQSCHSSRLVASSTVSVSMSKTTVEFSDGVGVFCQPYLA